MLHPASTFAILFAILGTQITVALPLGDVDLLGADSLQHDDILASVSHTRRLSTWLTEGGADPHWWNIGGLAVGWKGLAGVFKSKWVANLLSTLQEWLVCLSNLVFVAFVAAGFAFLPRRFSTCTAAPIVPHKRALLTGLPRARWQCSLPAFWAFLLVP